MKGGNRAGDGEEYSGRNSSSAKALGPLSERRRRPRGILRGVVALSPSIKTSLQLQALLSEVRVALACQGTSEDREFCSLRVFDQSNPAGATGGCRELAKLVPKKAGGQRTGPELV